MFLEIKLEMREQSTTNHMEKHAENDHKEPGITKLRLHFRNFVSNGYVLITKLFSADFSSVKNI